MLPTKQPFPPAPDAAGSGPTAGVRTAAAAEGASAVVSAAPSAVPSAAVSAVPPALALAWAAVCEAVRISNRATLSARHAMQAVAQLDHLSDVAFARRSDLTEPMLATAQDILSFRAALRGCEPALGPLMDLMACGASGPRLQVVAMPVAPDAFAKLAVADLMVSLYNGGTVPRLMLVPGDGQMLPMQSLLQSAALWWATTLGQSAA
jgi:hypothetical protein